jgi:hypothetical protein
LIEDYEIHRFPGGLNTLTEYNFQDVFKKKMAEGLGTIRTGGRR